MRWGVPPNHAGVDASRLRPAGAYLTILTVPASTDRCR